MRLRQRFALLVGAAMLAACVTDTLGPSDPGPDKDRANNPPTASFTAACSGLTCTLTDESADDDGSIATYHWDFGDGVVSTAPDPSHTYGRPGGEFSIGLIVTDDAGDSATTTRAVTVHPGESAVVSASFDFACTSLICTFFDRSTGPVVSYLWNFGDGTASDRQSPNHTFAQPGGRFEVRLTVIDSSSDESTAGMEIDVHVVEMRDISGTYDRETNDADRHSRIVIQSDGGFELLDWTETDTVVHAGRWRPLNFWMNNALEPGTVIGLDFDAFPESEFCGEAFGQFLTDAHLAIAACRPAIEAGLQEGVYSSAPSNATDVPPSQAGQIAFVRDGRIHRMNTDGSGLLQLTDGPADGRPAWSPDGSRIAFSRGGGDARGVYVANADGSNAVRLTNAGGEVDWTPEVDWSPDGESVVFVCGPPTVPDYSQLCRVGANGSGTDPVSLTPWLYGQVYSPAWSPDGTRIALVSDWAFFDIWFDIWTLAPDGTQFTALTSHTPGAPNPYAFHEPAWSPDGRRIAYGICPWAWNQCSSSALEVMNADGSGRTHLVTASGLTSATWSLDGESIAFSNGGNIEWVSADGSERGRIVNDGHSPSWRP